MLIKDLNIPELINKSKDRFELIKNIINKTSSKNVLELGVYKGDFAKKILDNCEIINKYYLLDSWKKLSDWNKPSNVADEIFNSYLNETKKKLENFNKKTIYLRGTTLEKINEIEDGELDFSYIDGDHTLKGITIDLINVFNKTKKNGFISGDDLSQNIFHHPLEFEPTLVFPFVVYYAQAVNCEVALLPYNQFLICKNNTYSFNNFTNFYSDVTLKKQIDLLISKLNELILKKNLRD